MPSCHKCGAEIKEKKPVRSSACACGAELRVCLNCRHFDRTAPQLCREPQADFVREKDRANFCDWFLLAANPAGKAAAGSGGKSTFDSLFKK